MIAHLREAEDDANRENFDDSRVKIEAVRSLINKRDSALISSNRQNRPRRDSMNNDTARSFLSGGSMKKNQVGDSREEEENRLIAEQVSRSTRRNSAALHFGQASTIKSAATKQTTSNKKKRPDLPPLPIG